VDKGLPAYNCREFFILFKETHMPNGFEVPAGTGDQVTGLMRKTLEAMAWKVSVILSNAREAKLDRLKRLVELPASTARTRGSRGAYAAMVWKRASA